MMKKFENNWKQKTLSNLEKEEWFHIDSDSQLIKRTNELRRTPLESFTTEDLRLMIGQKFGLNYLVPLAIEVLTENVFAEGDYFEGDLLKNILAIPKYFWVNNEDYWIAINELIKDKRDEISGKKFDTETFDNYNS